MSMLTPLLRANPASPRLTVYDETGGTRMEFSAQTLDNWAAKVANMLDEEFDLAPDSRVLVDVPVSWQAAVIAIGTCTASRSPELGDVEPSGQPGVVFTTPERASAWESVPDVVVVSPDPFGRGVVESGGELPIGTIDFGPTVRFYGDDYFGNSPELARWARDGVGAGRWRVGPWRDTRGFEDSVLAPLAAGGSVVVVTGLASAERLAAIDAAENVTGTLPAE